MPILDDFKLAESPEAFCQLQHVPSPFFLAFIASDDPVTHEPWCPDVRACLPIIKATFSPDDAPKAALIPVGQKTEYKAATNYYRTTWRVPNVPTLIRYERKGAELVEAGRLIEGEILDEKRLGRLVNGSS
ncbi:hypothetical protein F4808DRAFT_463070 [Astrocystis sublimbata]|nr:hypothetical protein F4808DRAFT_452161 [Astrocystis sublimbata]KAI0198236.1 hypothetical protein F4808DRAFT_463070 [Astrocystis sublimbata]